MSKSTFDLYASYGVLAHEKRTLYSFDCPDGVCHDVETFELPEGWKMTKNAYGGNLFESPTGATYFPEDCIISKRDDAYIREIIKGVTRDHKLKKIALNGKPLARFDSNKKKSR